MEINVTLASIFKNPVNRALVFVQTVANGLELAQHLGIVIPPERL